jgi:BTB/POZ domain
MAIRNSDAETDLSPTSEWLWKHGGGFDRLRDSYELDPKGDITLILSGRVEENTFSNTDLYSESSARDISVIVSSKHLSSGSAFFRAMFEGSFQERGRNTIELQGDPPAALISLLYVVHGGTWDMPRLLKLRDLTDVALTIDKYGFWEAAGSFRPYTDALLDYDGHFTVENLPYTCFVSWVLANRELFQKAIGIIVCWTPGLPQTDLPISQTIIGKELIHF